MFGTRLAQWIHLRRPSTTLQQVRPRQPGDSCDSIRKQWSDGLGLNPPTPDFRLFSLPGYDGIDVKSIDDLQVDPDDAKRVALVKSAAALWHRDVCLARVTLRHYGPLPFSPGNGFGNGLGHDGKHQTVLQCLAEFKPEAEVELGLARLSHTAGTTILPEAAGLGSELRLLSKFSPCHFIQDDFFGAVPDQEETVRPPGPSHHAWVRQTWTRNVSNSLPNSLRFADTNISHDSGSLVDTDASFMGLSSGEHPRERLWRPRHLFCRPPHPRAGTSVLLSFPTCS